MADEDDEHCPERKDGTHCHCWWDGDGCCSCGAAPMSVDAKLAQGMDVDDEPAR
jgi:hypothetical protein